MTIPELLTFYAAVEARAISLTAEVDPQDIYAGNVPHHASNGWTITIFCSRTASLLPNRG